MLKRKIKQAALDQFAQKKLIQEFQACFEGRKLHWYKADIVYSSSQKFLLITKVKSEKSFSKQKKRSRAYVRKIHSRNLKPKISRMRWVIITCSLCGYFKNTTGTNAFSLPHSFMFWHLRSFLYDYSCKKTSYTLNWALTKLAFNWNLNIFAQKKEPDELSS